MASNEKISIELPADVMSLVHEAVGNGDYASTDDVVRQALCEWNARRVARADKLAELRGLWSEGLACGGSAD